MIVLLCTHCREFLHGEFPRLAGDYEIAIQKMNCVEDFESEHGEIVHVSELRIEPDIYDMDMPCHLCSMRASHAVELHTGDKESPYLPTNKGESMIIEFQIARWFNTGGCHLTESTIQGKPIFIDPPQQWIEESQIDSITLLGYQGGGHPNWDAIIYNVRLTVSSAEELLTRLRYLQRRFQFDWNYHKNVSLDYFWSPKLTSDLIDAIMWSVKTNEPINDYDDSLVLECYSPAIVGGIQ